MSGLLGMAIILSIVCLVCVAICVYIIKLIDYLIKRYDKKGILKRFLDEDKE